MVYGTYLHFNFQEKMSKEKRNNDILFYELLFRTRIIFKFQIYCLRFMICSVFIYIHENKQNYILQFKLCENINYVDDISEKSRMSYIYVFVMYSNCFGLSWFCMCYGYKILLKAELFLNCVARKQTATPRILSGRSSDFLFSMYCLVYSFKSDHPTFSIENNSSGISQYKQKYTFVNCQKALLCIDIIGYIILFNYSIIQKAIFCYYEYRTHISTPK